MCPMLPMTRSTVKPSLPAYSTSRLLLLSFAHLPFQSCFGECCWRIRVAADVPISPRGVVRGLPHAVVGAKDGQGARSIAGPAAKERQNQWWMNPWWPSQYCRDDDALESRGGSNGCDNQPYIAMMRRRETSASARGERPLRKSWTEVRDTKRGSRSSHLERIEPTRPMSPSGQRFHGGW